MATPIKREVLMDAHAQLEERRTVLSALADLGRDVTNIKQAVTEMYHLLHHTAVDKEWYSTTELAEAMNITQFTVQERWCNQGRIEAEKDPNTGKWRIPRREFRRLVKGGALRPSADKAKKCIGEPPREEGRL